MSCSVKPTLETSWSYQVPGPIRGTANLASEGEAISEWATLVNAENGPAGCGVSVVGVGAVDAEWTSYYGYSPFDFKRYLVKYRKPVSYSICGKTYYPADKTWGPPLYYQEVTTNVYGMRSASCAEGWRTQDDDTTGYRFCYQPQPIEDKTCPAGNPVSVGIGDKLHTEDDYIGSGPDALSFGRSYRSRWPYVANSSSAGLLWFHRYDLRIHKVIFDATHAVLRVMRPGNSVAVFVLDPASTAAAPVWLSKTTKDQIAQTGPIDAPSGYTYKAFETDVAETYDGNGRLQSIRQRNGYTTTLTYSDSSTPVAVYLTDTTAPQPGLLIAVTNHFGRKLGFAYNATGQLTQFLPPGAVKDSGAGLASSPIRYAYAEPANLGAGVRALGQLTSVTWQDGSVKRYHYEDSRFPAALTGVTDEAGVRAGTYSYNGSGQVVEEYKVGGVDKLQFTYGGNSAGIYDFSGLNGSYVYRSYTFQNTNGVVRPVTVSSPSPLCGNTQANTTYDAAGNTTKTIGHDGLVTFYAYDAKGRETERAQFSSAYQSATARPALSAAQKVTSTKWHATWNLPTQVAEPGKITAYTYDSKGNLTGQNWTATTDSTGQLKFSATKTGSTYATGWSYNSNSLATTIVNRETPAGLTTATETGRWTLAYNALGDVTSVKDVKSNLTATITRYDLHGNALELVDFSGIRRTQAVSPRGILTAVGYGTQTTTYQLNAIGLAWKVTNPFGDVTEYVYDANHHLTDVKLNGQSVVLLSANTNRLLIALDRIASMFSGSAWAQTAPSAGGAWEPTRPANPIDWLLPGRAIAEANRNLALALQRLIDRCLSKDETQVHRGRIQVQGTDYPGGTSGSGDSESWTQSTPPSASDVLAMLDRLESRMTATQYRNRSIAIAQARKYIASRPPTGVSAPLSKTWMNPGMTNERIDLEVIEGDAFKN